MASRWPVALALLLTGALAAACSNDSKPTPTPTSPTTNSLTTGSSSGPIDITTTDTPVGTVNAGADKPVTGAVEKFDSACPLATFVISGVTVHLTVTTAFDTGFSCASLHDGVRAGAIGTKNQDGSINAARVKIAPVLPPQPTPITGTVSSVTGTCPAITFVVNGVTFATSAQTIFEGGDCTDVKVGAKLGAFGPIANGVVTAEHIRFPPPLVVVTGLVSAMTGTCPDIGFILTDPQPLSTPGAKVLANARTKFEGGSCDDLRKGYYAGAIGQKNAEGVLEAQGVKMAMPK